MFSFTTENVLNDLSRVSVVLPADDQAIPTGGTGLKVKSLNTFIVSHMSPVWTAPGTIAVKEVAALTVPAITAGLYRLELQLTLSGSATADFSRFDIDYGKPVYVELLLTAADTATTVAAKLNKYFNLYNAPESIKGITVAVVGGKIQLTANTEYVRFTSAVLEKYNETLFVYEPFSTLFEIITPGAVGFGTAWYLLQNLRMPTQAATYITAQDQDERPIAGALYNQYTFRYESNRNIHNMGAVAAKATSSTTHVLYVLATLATTFEALLATAGAEVVVVSTDTARPIDFWEGSDVPPVAGP